MSGGGKLEKINTRERAVSTDINRLQAFQAYDRAEVLRRLMNNRLADSGASAYGGGVQEVGSTVLTSAQDSAPIDAPLRADVYEGLMVLPQVGTLSVLVSPGCVGLDDPDGQAGSSDPTAPNPDDSRYKVVVDPGIAVNGTLVFGAGAGSTRIDIVECRRTSVVVETDNRDIFDPSTGLFSAVAVTKVFEGRLTYRVRAGVAGAGIPANVQGWLPLCVASIPSTATSVDDITFWDVRPLVKDRIDHLTDTQQVVATLQGSNQIIADDKTDAAKTMLYGYSTSQIGMWRCGGVIGGPLVSDGIDAQNVINQGAGYTPVGNLPWYLYAVFPGGLPRWVKYAPFPSLRVPNGPLGVLTVSSIGPTLTTGNALGNSIPVPSATGLSASGYGGLLASSFCSATPAPQGFVMRDGLVMNSIVKSKGPVSSTATTDTYRIVMGNDCPMNAKSVVLLFACGLTAGGANARLTSSVTIDMLKPATATALIRVFNGNEEMGTTTAGGAANLSTTQLELPTVPVGVAGAGYSNNDLYLVINWGQSVGTKDSPQVFILGWRV